MPVVSERFVFTGTDVWPAYSAAVDAILEGQLVVLPTDTVYGIAADAFKADAVQRLLEAKGRGRDMPPPVLISAVETLDALATSVSDAARALCEEFWPGALTVICLAQSSLMWDLGETKGTVALRVPDHENTRELLSRTGPLAVSSANISGKPAATDVYDAERQLGDAVRIYLDGGPVTDAAENALPSTIVDVTGEVPRVIRLGAISLERLREIAPETIGPDGELPPERQPEPETAPDVKAEAEPEPEQAPPPLDDEKAADKAEEGPAS
jgi:L-threonylcarbamoyladenylate synthase